MYTYTGIRAGKALYQLDDDTFQAALGSAKATLGNAKAALAQAQAGLAQAKATRNLYRSTVNRYAPLVKAKAVSRQTYDQAVSNLKVQESNIKAARASIAAAKANIAVAKAGVKKAQINLQYAAITSPIDGIIGRSEVSEGAYVVASQTQMAKVQQLDPMHVNITLPASQLAEMRKNFKDNANIKQMASKPFIPIFLENGTPYPHKARFLFVDKVVNQSTGELSIRAEVPNPNKELLPGLYVRVSLPQSKLSDAYLIPQQAVTRGEKNTVVVVEPTGKYHPQVVSIVGQQGQDWVVKGLNAGQKVVVDGMGQMAIMMGAPVVQTRPWQAKKK